jgi:redox-sensitive bicupin YhaK (pirin superfamily)
MNGAAANTQDQCEVELIVGGQPAMDGAGVKLTRIIGSPELNRTDPFLLFDVFESDQPGDYIAGFPPHPHRGFETVTYMLAGRMEHRDSAGNHGVIETGGVQWMTAARGIIHSEMPKQQEGLLSGVQLWVNLPARLKMSAPGYREFPADEITVEQRAGAEIRVVAGTTATGIAGPVQGVVTEPVFLDVTLMPCTTFTERLPAGHRAILYVVDGEVSVADRAVVTGRRLAVMGDGDELRLRAGPPGARLLLVAAQPLGEPVARGGPFVMNTREEIHQAFADFEAGRLLG